MARFVPTEQDRYYIIYRILTVRVYEQPINIVDPGQPPIQTSVRLFNGVFSNLRAANTASLAWNIDVFSISYVRVAVTGDFVMDSAARMYPAWFIGMTPYFNTGYIDMATSLGCSIRVSMVSDNGVQSIRVSISSFKTQSWLANVRVYKV